MSSTMRTLLIAILLLSAADAIQAQTTKIVTSRGSKYIGTIVRESPDTVFLHLGGGIEAAIPRSLIQWVDSSYVQWERGYFGIGLTAGFPAALNLVLEANIGGTFGLRATGGAMMIIGYEIDALIRFNQSHGSDHAFLVGAGTFSYDPGVMPGPEFQHRYLHAGYEVYYRGFNMTFTMSVGEGDGKRFTPLFQIGYLLRM